MFGIFPTFKFNKVYKIALFASIALFVLWELALIEEVFSNLGQEDVILVQWSGKIVRKAYKHLVNRGKKSNRWSIWALMVLSICLIFDTLWALWTQIFCLSSIFSLKSYLITFDMNLATCCKSYPSIKWLSQIFYKK